MADQPAAAHRHRLGRHLRSPASTCWCRRSTSRPRALHRPHPAGRRARLDGHPRRRAAGRGRGRQDQGRAAAQSRRAALRRPGQCRPVAAGGVCACSGSALLAQGISVSTIGLGLRLQRGPDAAAGARQRRQPRLRARAHRPDPDLQQGVRRRAGLVRADGVDRHRAEARRAGRAGAEPRRRHRAASGPSSRSTRSMPRPSTTCCWRSSSTRRWPRRRAGAGPRQGRLYASRQRRAPGARCPHPRRASPPPRRR